tara:strand:- start:303 stop:1211 length:909 start_codon:yes stop_codon:yes gene_type:complete
MDNWVRPTPKPDDEFTYQWNADWVNDPEQPLLKITKSSMNCYEWCKKQYEFQYIDRRPTDMTDALLKGSAVHDGYEKFYDIVEVDVAENMSESELIDYFTTLFPIDDYFQVYDSIISFETQRFMDDRNSGTLDKFVPAGNEIKLDAKITIPAAANAKYPLRNNYKVHLQGIIDRIFLENGGYVLMELKTGLWKERKLSSMRKEMAYYKLLYESCEPEVIREVGLDPDIPITHWGWFYPESNYTYVEECKRASQSTLPKKFAQMIHSYEENLFPADYYYRKCVYCSFMGICDAAINFQLQEDW